jgi:hypothetical protein
MLLLLLPVQLVHLLLVAIGPGASSNAYHVREHAMTVSGVALIGLALEGACAVGGLLLRACLGNCTNVANCSKVIEELCT